MEKQKKVPFRIEWGKVWGGLRGEIKDWLSVFSIIVPVVVFSLLVALIIVWIVSDHRSSEERFAQYQQYYAECLFHEISETACETAALDYAGLDGNDD